ncbi:serine/threonine-protein kinase [Sphaerisporangium dianthi]|uniref:Serine/threonine-protein kinase n=1 Tax=Sphaerisporangium dianthi TaxID=1436120 RepID=A0ABV9CNW0_9ACTN
MVNNLSPDDPLQIGRYRLIGRLGRGGMGTVYLGQDETGQRVAVKVINPEYSQHEQFRVRFRREAESASRVRRFCTAAVLDAALDGDQLYVVTEYVDGPNLYDAVQSSGPLRGSSLDALAVGVATALTAIHSAGVVHRDLKPSNVLLSPVGPRVIDFGIARALDTLSGITGTGQLMGTPRYMAPEVLRGAPASPACDVFSWGCLVAFAASGRAPFGGESLPSIVYQVLNTEASLEGLEPALRGLVAATLDKDPVRRPTAQQILDQMVGRTTPERAQHTVVQTWQTQTTAAARPGTTATSGQPATLAGQPVTGTGYPATVAGQPPTIAGQPPTVAGRPPTMAAPPPRPGAAGVAAIVGQKKLIVLAVIVVAVAALGLRAWLSPSGPPAELSYNLYRDDFNEGGTGWGGGEYTGKEYNTYGYAPGGFYAVDVDDQHTERIEKAPLPFVPKQPATPVPSATPTPTTPEQLLLTVTTSLREFKGPGEYGLFCRADEESRQSRYEFLLTAQGEARIRRITKGTGGNLTPPVAVSDLKQGAKLQAECATTDQGVRLRMWVNDEPVQSYVDNSGAPASLPNGDVGFLVRVPEKSGATLKASFDDFTVQGPALAAPKRD